MSEYVYRTWDQLTRREQLLSEISDTHKMVYGVRYRGNTDHMSDDDLQRFLDDLYEWGQREILWEAEEEAYAIKACLDSGADSVETALRWLEAA